MEFEGNKFDWKFPLKNLNSTYPSAILLAFFCPTTSTCLSWRSRNILNGLWDINTFCGGILNPSWSLNAAALLFSVLFVPFVRNTVGTTKLPLLSVIRLNASLTRGSRFRPLKRTPSMSRTIPNGCWKYRCKGNGFRKLTACRVLRKKRFCMKLCILFILFELILLEHVEGMREIN